MAKKKKREKAISQVKEQQLADNNKHLLSSILLSVTSFVCGCLVMVVELTSTRVLAPFYGNTIYCWTGVIGTILFALSIGYLVGGILADRYAARKLLIVLLSLSCFFIATIPSLAQLFFAGFLATQSATTGPILATLLIFLFPAFFLATIPPICVKIISHHFKMVGFASGLVSSISALGSIIGTFATGFYLIPFFKLATIYYLSACIILLLLVIFVLLKSELFIADKLFFLLIVGGATLIFWGGVSSKNVHGVFPHTGEEYRHLTPYHLIRVYDNQSHYLLKLDSTNEGALSKVGYDLVFDYTKYCMLIKCLMRKQELHRACFIGGGAFAMPTALYHQFPDLQIDVIEIDPHLAKVAQKYFKLPTNPRYQVHTEDGRKWFRMQKREYDFMFLDAFHGIKNVPFHLVTTEYFRELHRSLADHGILGINIISPRDGKQDRLYKSISKSLLQSFARILVFAVHSHSEPLKSKSSNLLLFCLKNAASYNARLALRKAKKYNLSHLYDNLVEIVDRSQLDSYQNVEEFTDQYAPVEYIVMQQGDYL